MSARIQICGTIVLLCYLGYGLLGLILEHLTRRFELTPPPHADRWNLAHYSADGHRWVRRSHWWHRARYIVWLGLVVIISVGCGLFG